MATKLCNSVNAFAIQLCIKQMRITWWTSVWILLVSVCNLQCFLIPKLLVWCFFQYSASLIFCILQKKNLGNSKFSYEMSECLKRWTSKFLSFTEEEAMAVNVLPEYFAQLATARWPRGRDKSIESLNPILYTVISTVMGWMNFINECVDEVICFKLIFIFSKFMIKLNYLLLSLLNFLKKFTAMDALMHCNILILNVYESQRGNSSPAPKNSIYEIYCETLGAIQWWIITKTFVGWWRRAGRREVSAGSAMRFRIVHILHGRAAFNLA